MYVPFEYLYYRIYKTVKILGEGAPASYAVHLLSTLQMMNIFSILFLTPLKFRLKNNELLIAFLVLILLVVNRLYFKNKYNFYAKKWDNENSSIRELKGFLIVIYILLSFIGVFFLAVRTYNMK